MYLFIKSQEKYKMASPPFWSSKLADPKRNYRWVFLMQGTQPFTCKSVTKPSYTVGQSDLKYLDHTFKFPTVLTWNDCTVTFHDPGGGPGNDATDEFVNKLKTSGYFYPNDPTELSTISRDKSIIALGEPQIMQLNSDGEPIEIWTLHNAWIKSATFGNLAYANDDTVELSIVLVYDFATIEVQ